MSTKPQTCLQCKHCYFDGGEQGYSELTPGSPMVFRCKKDEWTAKESDKRELVSYLNMAATCTSFEEEK